MKQGMTLTQTDSGGMTNMFESNVKQGMTLTGLDTSFEALLFESNVKQDAVNLTLAKNCFDPYNGKAVLF